MKKIKRGEIWFCNNVNTYQKGILTGARPVLIISNNKWHSRSPVVNVAMISSNIEKKSPVHLKIELDEPSVINIEQLYTINRKNLVRKITVLSKEQMIEVDKLLLFQFNLKS